MYQQCFTFVFERLTKIPDYTPLDLVMLLSSVFFIDSHHVETADVDEAMDAEARVAEEAKIASATRLGLTSTILPFASEWRDRHKIATWSLKHLSKFELWPTKLKALFPSNAASLASFFRMRSILCCAIVQQLTVMFPSIAAMPGAMGLLAKREQIAAADQNILRSELWQDAWHRLLTTPPDNIDEVLSYVVSQVEAAATPKPAEKDHTDSIVLGSEAAGASPAPVVSAATPGAPEVLPQSVRFSDAYSCNVLEFAGSACVDSFWLRIFSTNIENILLHHQRTSFLCADPVDLVRLECAKASDTSISEVVKLYQFPSTEELHSGTLASGSCTLCPFAGSITFTEPKHGVYFKIGEFVIDTSRPCLQIYLHGEGFDKITHSSMLPCWAALGQQNPKLTKDFITGTSISSKSPHNVKLGFTTLTLDVDLTTGNVSNADDSTSRLALLGQVNAYLDQCKKDALGDLSAQLDQQASAEGDAAAAAATVKGGKGKKRSQPKLTAAEKKRKLKDSEDSDDIIPHSVRQFFDCIIRRPLLTKRVEVRIPTVELDIANLKANYMVDDTSQAQEQPTDGKQPAPLPRIVDPSILPISDEHGLPLIFSNSWRKDFDQIFDPVAFAASAMQAQKDKEALQKVKDDANASGKDVKAAVKEFNASHKQQASEPPAIGMPSAVHELRKKLLGRIAAGSTKPESDPMKRIRTNHLIS